VSSHSSSAASIEGRSQRGTLSEPALRVCRALLALLVSATEKGSPVYAVY
jgi:hypothetical protein